MIVITTFLDKPTRYHTCNTHEEAEDRHFYVDDLYASLMVTKICADAVQVTTLKNMV